MRHLLTALIALLLVTAGCVGVYGPPVRPKPAPAEQGTPDEDSDSEQGSETRP